MENAVNIQHVTAAVDQARAAPATAFIRSAEAPRFDRWSCDPLEPDADDDERMTTTSRRLLRLAIAAADAGARFARDGLDHDPVAWLIAPRAMFGDRPAIDACQDRRHFTRSILVQGLGMDLNASPSDLDELLEDGDEDDQCGTLDDGDAGARGGDEAGAKLPRPLLLSCWLNVTCGSGRLFAFCAVVTDRPADLVERVVGRYGADAASTADFSAGFDHTTPLATAMISDALADTLALAAADPESPLAAGLDVVVEQRFLA